LAAEPGGFRGLRFRIKKGAGCGVDGQIATVVQPVIKTAATKILAGLIECVTFLKAMPDAKSRPRARTRAAAQKSPARISRLPNFDRRAPRPRRHHRHKAYGRLRSSAPNRQRLAPSEMSPIDRWHCHPSGRDAAGRSGRLSGGARRICIGYAAPRCCRLARRERGLTSRKTANVDRDLFRPAPRSGPRSAVSTWPDPSTMRHSAIPP
jgi:hypothetical protein